MGLFNFTGTENHGQSSLNFFFNKDKIKLKSENSCSKKVFFLLQKNAPINVHVLYLGTLLKYRFCLTGSAVKPESLQF